MPRYRLEHLFQDVGLLFIKGLVKAARIIKPNTPPPIALTVMSWKQRTSVKIPCC